MDNGEETDPVALALAQPLILDRIVDHALHFSYATHEDEDESVKLHREALSDLRLVSKAWKESVNRVLELRGAPLFTVILTEDNCLNASRSVKEHGKELDNFMEFLPTTTDTPTFRLTVQEPVFRLENYDSLLSCFQKCSTYLKEMVLRIPHDCGSLPGLLPNLNLPSLSFLKCIFTGKIIDEAESDPVIVPANSVNQTMLLFSLLNGVAVKELHLCNIYSYTPAFQLLGLPQSLTKLRLHLLEENAVFLEILFRNSLPNLNALILSGVTRHDFPADMIARVLEKFRFQLRQLTLYGCHIKDKPILPTVLRFPVMENLEELKIQSIMWKLEAPIENLNAVFPKLRSLELLQQSRKTLAKWISATSSPMESVEELALQLVNPADVDLDTIALDKESMASVHHTFPNITRLNLVVAGKKKKGLQYVFRNMRPLQHLSIKVKHSERIECPNHWDSVLTGIPEPHLHHGCVVAAGLVERLPSIKMLKELRSLHLLESHQQHDYPLCPLITDVTFTHAINKMSKLERVRLDGRFGICSEEIHDKWNKNTGRRLELGIFFVLE